MNGDGPLPVEYWLSRLCEEFGALPSEMLAELERLPAGTLESILEYRQFGRAIAIYEQSTQAPGELVALIKTIDFELVADELARKRQEGRAGG